MKCLVPTPRTVLVPTACPDLAASACAPCPADERQPKPCGQVTASGGQGVTRTRHALGPAPGLVRITYDMYSIPDRLDCFYKGVLVASTGGLVSGSGTAGEGGQAGEEQGAQAHVSRPPGSPA